MRYERCSSTVKAVLHLLEAPHAVKDIELLPAFGEIDLPVYEVGVPQMHEGQVLEDEASVRRRRKGNQTNSHVMFH